MSKMIVQYSRNADKHPNGVLIAMRHPRTKKVVFGWSASDEPKTFTRKEAVERAVKRAKSKQVKPVASSLSNVATSKFVKRCEKYFREDSLYFTAFVMLDDGIKPKKYLCVVTSKDRGPTVEIPQEPECLTTICPYSNAKRPAKRPVKVTQIAPNAVLVSKRNRKTIDKNAPKVKKIKRIETN